MPWCEGCNRYLAAPTVRPDGTCPACRRSLAPQTTDGADSPRAPWHFKVLVAAAGAYLALRGAQGVVWIIERLS